MRYRASSDHEFPESPFEAVQRSFDLLIQGPARSQRLATGDIDAVEGAEIAADELVALLRTGEVGLADALWRRVIEHARAGESYWSVIAAAAMLPRLVTTSSWFAGVGLGEDYLVDLEAEMLAALLDQLRSMDTSVTDVGSHLWYAALKSGRRFRYRALRDTRRHHPCARLDGRTTAACRGPVSVLAAAVGSGVLTDTQAELIARTRLEPRTSLRHLAAELGLSYITARRWRADGEERIGARLGAQKSSPR